jgi:hypothetical protein
MTRAQFAAAVGVPEKWVHNAVAALRHPVSYTPAAARRLAVAHAIQGIAPVSLASAYRTAGAVLASPLPESGTVGILSTAGGSVTLDLSRVLSTFAARLACAMHHTPRRPGRRATVKKSLGNARERARAYGLDLSLIDGNLRRSPQERLAALDANVAFVSALARRRTSAIRRNRAVP